MAPKKQLKTLKKGVNSKKASGIKGGRRMPTRHQANIKFGDMSIELGGG
jgi:hypothetical protein